MNKTLIKCPSRIAILMATYNGERFIKEQIDSIINQSFHDWTLYICDDGSTDKTIRIIEKYCNEFENIYHVPKYHHKKGACANFMELLKLIESEFYMFCDQDDVWLPHKIQLTFNSIKDKNQDRPLAICTDLTLVSTNLEQLHFSMWIYAKLKPKYLKKWRYLRTCNILTGCTMLINNKAKAVSLDYEEALMHDSWIGLKTLANQGEVICIDTPTILYRQHGENVLGSPGKVNISYYASRLLHLIDVIKHVINQYRFVNKIKKTSFIDFVYSKAQYSFLRIK